MKKLFSTTLALLLAASLTAQFSFESVSFGARAGFNLTSVYGSAVPDEAQHKAGFQVGVVAQMPIFDGLLTIQPGLLFAQQGHRVSLSTIDTLPIMFGSIITESSTSSRTNINYLQIPINVQFKHEVNNGMTLVLQAGPYLGIALGGRIKGDMSRTVRQRQSFMGEVISDIEEITERALDDDIRFGAQQRRFDLGLGIGAGVEFGNFQVGIGYNLGFVNRTYSRNNAMRHTGFALTVTYLF